MPEDEFAAAHAASTIQRRLERMGEAVNAMTRDPDLLQLWRRYEQNGRQETDRAPLQAYFDKKRDSYNNDPVGVCPSGRHRPICKPDPVDREGRFKAYSPSNLIVTDKDYSGRDYFLRGEAAGGRSRRPDVRLSCVPIGDQPPLQAGNLRPFPPGRPFRWGRVRHGDDRREFRAGRPERQAP